MRFGTFGRRRDAGAPRTARSETLAAALRSRGFESDDFRLEEDAASPLAQLLGVVGGTLTVKCRSTGEERLYATGAGSAWLGAFVTDLARGHFAEAARAAQGRVPGMSGALRPAGA